MKKLVWLILFSPFFLNAASLYKVEVIVFSHLTAAAYDSEVWPLVPELPDMSRVQNLTAAQAPVRIYESLPSNYYSLNRDVVSLRKSGQYRVLAHVAWLQPMSSPRNAHRIHLYGGAAYDATGTVVTNDPMPHYWQLNGFVRVSRPSTYQIDTSLVLTLPKAEVAQLTKKSLDASVYQFLLTQSEHPKLKEIYYFDHPLLGMLLQITIVKK